MYTTATFHRQPHWGVRVTTHIGFTLLAYHTFANRRDQQSEFPNLWAAELFGLGRGCVGSLFFFKGIFKIYVFIEKKLAIYFLAGHTNPYFSQ